MPYVGKSLTGMLTLGFEGLQDHEDVLDFYNAGKGSRGSGPGPNYGIVFSANATAFVDGSTGGTGNTSGEPSPPTTLTFLSGTAATMTVAGGFDSGFSFYYCSPFNSGKIQVYDGPNATGNLLAVLDLPATPVNPNGTPAYAIWVPIGVSFGGTARSVDFGGAADYIGFDNITFGASTPHPRQVSSTVHGTPTTKDSTHVTLTSNGSSALFQSQESDLVANNLNSGGQDIFRVGDDGKAVLESVNNLEQQLIGTSSSSTISPSGEIVAFLFAPVATSQSAKAGIFQSIYAGPSGGSKHAVDTGMAGAPPDGSANGAPSLNMRGDKLVFCSLATNLVSGDSNGKFDVFLANPRIPKQAIQRVSTDSHGAQLSGDSCEPRISADGNEVVFTTSAPELFGTNARQVVRKDLRTGTLELLSPSTTGAGKGGNGNSSEPVIDNDGKTVAFTSRASDLDSLGTPAGSREAFVSIAHSSNAGAARVLKRLRAGDGTVPNGYTQHPQLSADGSIAVLQTSATNFFGPAKTLFTSGCGSVAISTNFYTPALLGSSLCDGKTTNSSPTISPDGGTAGYDSNAAQPGTSSSNSNAYSQPLGTSSNGVAAMSGDFSGQWFNPEENGHGLVIDVFQPDANNNRIVNMTWFVYTNGQPTWVQGSGVAKAGTGTRSGSVVVQIDKVGIFKSSGFPAGHAVSAELWGSMTLTFSDANNGTMEWTSNYPGFNNFYEPLKRFLPAQLPAQDAADAQVKACYSGNWFDPTLSGQGFEFEVVTLAGPPEQHLLAVDWFAFDPTTGAPTWLSGVGTISGNSVQAELGLFSGAGAKFPPNYNPTEVKPVDWGSVTVKFTDSAHAQLSWSAKLPGYGSGQLALQPLGGAGPLDRRGCQ